MPDVRTAGVVSYLKPPTTNAHRIAADDGTTGTARTQNQDPAVAALECAQTGNVDVGFNAQCSEGMRVGSDRFTIDAEVETGQPGGGMQFAQSPLAETGAPYSLTGGGFKLFKGVRDAETGICGPGMSLAKRRPADIGNPRFAR